jgi:hypothetical protein
MSTAERQPDYDARRRASKRPEGNGMVDEDQNRAFRVGDGEDLPERRDTDR